MTALALALSLLLTQADAGSRVEDGVRVVPVFVPPTGTGMVEPGAPASKPSPVSSPSLAPVAVRLLDGGFARTADGGLLMAPLPGAAAALADAGRADGGALGPVVPLGTPDLVPVGLAAPVVLPDGGLLALLPDAGLDAGEPEGEVTIHVGIEISGMALPSTTPGGQFHGYASVSPILGLDAGDDFDGELGATFNLLVVDTVPSERDEMIGHVLRKKDWDEGSDFGQIFRHIRIGREDSELWVKLGGVRRKTLGLGHLVDRYSNQDNFDYHPAALEVGVNYGPVSAESFVSDLLGPRIYSGQLVWDLGSTFSAVPDNAGRYHVALSVAHDSGVAGAVGSLTPAELRTATLAEADLSAVLWHSEVSRLLLAYSMGGRFKEVPDFGATLGLAMESVLGTVSLGGRLELRKQAGGYRQGFFGPGYELARFADVGLRGVSRLQADLPDAFSLALDGHVSFGPLFTFSADAEFFTWGRTDVDLIMAFQLPGGRAVGAGRLFITGLGESERYFATFELRLRLFENLYLLGATGTAFFPKTDDTLSRGLITTAGFGFDLTR